MNKMKSCLRLKTSGFCLILKNTLMSNDESPERQKFNRLLWNKAWICSNILITYRTLTWASGTSSWDKFYDK